MYIYIYRHSETEVISETQDRKAGKSNYGFLLCATNEEKMVVTHDFKINHLLILLSILSC